MSRVLENLGVISGRKLDGGQSGVGTIYSPDAATPERVAAARRHYKEAAWADFDEREGYYVDRASGLLYRKVPGDPLLGFDRDSAKEISFFTITDAGQLLFLQRPGGGPGSVHDLDAAIAEAAKREAAAAKERIDWLAGQRQMPVLAPGFGLTLREAAAHILSAGGRITRGDYGELRITAPERLVPDDGNVMRGGLEREAWAEVAAAAEVLAYCDRVVLAALDGKGKLVDPMKLPDGAPTVGGGVAS